MADPLGDTRTLDGPRADLAHDEALLRPGQVLGGRYCVTRLLAQGGMGTVYAATDQQLAEDIAVKVLRGGRLDADGFKQLVDEARLARRVTHPNVCRVYDLGTDGALVFLTMELLEGESLEARWLREGKLAVDEVLRLVTQLAHGLDAAHEAGVIHRDFKPSNVMLVGKKAVITDFGIARLAAARTTTSGTMKGTPAYISPEQLEGKKVTPASDVYALGVATFELLTGKLPFKGKDAMELAMSRLSSRPPTVRSVEPKVSRSVSAAIDQALERDPARRFATAGQFAAALVAPPKSTLGAWWGRLRGE
jgi:serine/threonine protein kinase